MFQNTFPERETIAELTAKMLWEIGAVHFRADEPYTFTSGLKSPVYIDCRKLISYPRIRSAVSDFGVATVMRDAGFEKYDVVAGGETAGIPYAAFLAERLGLPMIYIRKKPKGFGRNARIEGDLKEGQRVLFVEDLTTDGGSKIVGRVLVSYEPVDEGTFASGRFAHDGNLGIRRLTFDDFLVVVTRREPVH